MENNPNTPEKPSGINIYGRYDADLRGTVRFLEGRGIDVIVRNEQPNLTKGKENVGSSVAMVAQTSEECIIPPEQRKRARIDIPNLNMTSDTGFVSFSDYYHTPTQTPFSVPLGDDAPADWALIPLPDSSMSCESSPQDDKVKNNVQEVLSTDDLLLPYESNLSDNEIDVVPSTFPASPDNNEFWDLEHMAYTFEENGWDLEAELTKCINSSKLRSL